MCVLKFWEQMEAMVALRTVGSYCRVESSWKQPKFPEYALEYTRLLRCGPTSGHEGCQFSGASRHPPFDSSVGETRTYKRTRSCKTDNAGCGFKDTMPVSRRGVSRSSRSVSRRTKAPIAPQDGEQEQTLRDEAFATLDEAITSHKLVDLHTHLMGMGSADFWVTWIMFTYLPRRVNFMRKSGSAPNGDGKAQEMKEAVQAIVEGVVGINSRCELIKTDAVSGKFKLLCEDIRGDSWTRNADSTVPQQSPTDSTVSPNSPFAAQLQDAIHDLPTEFKDKFTSDVVYSVEELSKAFGENGVDRGDSGPVVQEMSTSRVQSFFGSENVIETFVVFDAIALTFEEVTGVSNSSIKRVWEKNRENEIGKRLIAFLRNAFSFLNSDGSDPKAADFGIWRGAFTPEFDPRRFQLKRRITTQCPDVISILLANACERYWKAGVGYVEFSVSLKWLLRPHIWKFLLSEVFVEESIRSSTLSDKWRWMFFGNLLVDEGYSGDKVEEKHEETDKKETKEDDAKGSEPPNKKPRKEQNANKKKPPAPPLGIWNTLQKSTPAETKSNPQWMEILRRTSHRHLPQATADRKRMACKIFQYRFLAAVGRNEEKGDVVETRTNRLEKLAGINGTDELSNCVVPDKVEDMFPSTIQNVQYIKEMLSDNKRPTSVPVPLADKGCSWLKWCWRAYVVGFDVVGDETAAPYIPLVHPVFREIAEIVWKGGNPHFGVRVHGGESVPLAPKSATDSTLAKAFSAHMSILHDCIEKLHEQFPPVTVHQKKTPRGKEVEPIRRPRVRIGHGVAFLYSDNKEAKKGLEFIKQNRIPIEVNLTSNNHLLLDTQSQLSAQPAGNSLVLSAVNKFKEQKCNIIMSTDDDGIWVIHKCAEHYFHSSVGAEYCRMIQDAGLKMDEVEEMVKNGRYSVFVPVDGQVVAGEGETHFHGVPLNVFPERVRASTNT